jgi:hypothetical protein
MFEIITAALVAVIIAATVIVTVRDGYGRRATR